MLKSHANLVAGNTGHVLWCNDILEASLTNESSASNFWHMDAHVSAENHPRKVVIVNEGARDAVALLGKWKLVVLV